MHRWFVRWLAIGAAVAVCGCSGSAGPPTTTGALPPVKSRPTGVVSGRLILGGGIVVVGADTTIEFIPSGAGRMSSRAVRVRTNATGAFRFRGAAGVYRAELRTGPLVLAPGRIAVVAGRTVHVVLEPPGAALDQ